MSPITLHFFLQLDVANDLYFFDKGMIPKGLLDRGISEGSAFVNGRLQTVFLLSEIEKLYGFQPFRIGRDDVMFFNSAFGLQVF